MKKRLTGDCLKLFGNIDPSNYLANFVSIGSQTYSGTPFFSDQTFATTTWDTDAKGARLASGHTMFNQNSAFFTGTVGGRIFPGDVLSETASMYGLSLDQIREVAILHELFHVNDIQGKYDDGDPVNKTQNEKNSKAINKLIRDNAGFTRNHFKKG